MWRVFSVLPGQGVFSIHCSLHCRLLFFLVLMSHYYRGKGSRVPVGRRSIAHEVSFQFSPDGVNVDGHHIPVNVTLRRIAHGADAVAAQWDFDLLNGQGGWKSDGCHILYSDENITTIQCLSLSNYAVLMVWPWLLHS